MVCVLLNLPASPQCSVLSEWFGASDLAFLDSAFCSTAERPVYLRCLSIYQYTPMNQTRSHSKGYYTWLALRNMKVRSIVLSAFCKEPVNETIRIILHNIQHLNELSMNICSNMVELSKLLRNKVCSLSLTRTEGVDNRQLIEILSNVGPNVSTLSFTDYNGSNGKTIDIIIKYLPNLTALNGHGLCHGEDFQKMADAYPNLRQVHIGGVDNENPSHFEYFASKCTELEEIFISDYDGATDDDIVAVCQHCPKVTSLSVDEGTVTDIGISAVAKALPHLKVFYMGSSKVSDESVMNLAANCPYITDLDLSACTNITDKSVCIIATTYPLMQMLHLKSSKLTDASVLAIASNCPLLAYITVDLSPLITDASIAVLIEKCPKLNDISADGCKNQSGMALLKLGTDYNTIDLTEETDKDDDDDPDLCVGINIYRDKTGRMHYTGYLSQSILHAYFLVDTSITSLTLRFSNTDDSFICDSLKRCPLLESLDVESCSGLTGQIVGFIAENCRFIQALNLKNMTGLTDSVVRQLAEKVPKLREFRVEAADITDAAVFAIVKHCSKSLEKLDVCYCTKITNRSIAKLIHSCVKLRTLILNHCKDNITGRVMNEILQSGRKIRVLQMRDCGGPLLSYGTIDKEMMQFISLCPSLLQAYWSDGSFEANGFLPYHDL